MSSSKANDFLIKQLDINKEVVTFRWLSRELSIHVNAAKNELASFYASSKATDRRVYATYLLTGDVSPTKAAREIWENHMDVDESNRELICTRKIMLVGESNLESAKCQFTHVPSIHVYSLSPSPITDAALNFGTIADLVRPMDVSKGKAYNESIGIVVSPDVKIGYAGKSKAAASKEIKAPPAASSSSTAPVVAPEAVGMKAKLSEKAKSEEKKIGTLDWSKAKPKTVKEKGKDADLAPKAKSISKQPSNVKIEEGEDLKPNAEAELDVTRLISKNDTGTPLSSPIHKPATRERGVKVKRGVLLSDDEAEEVPKRAKLTKKGKGSSRTLISDDEDVDPGLRAMMDLDDSEVNRSTRKSVPESEPALSQEEEDMERLSDVQIPAQPKSKRKSKKVVPLGKNGLPKKRVVKSRKTKNAKGYMVTEDYSSYESISESEQLPASLPTEQATKEDSKKMKVKGGIAKGKREHDELTSEKLTANKEKPETVKSTSKISSKAESLKKDSNSASSKTNNGGQSQNLMSYFKKK